MHEMMTWGTHKPEGIEEGASSCHGIPWIEEDVAEAAFKLWNMECGCGINHSPPFFLLLSNHLYFLFFFSLNINQPQYEKKRRRRRRRKECDMHVIQQTLCSPLPLARYSI